MGYGDSLERVIAKLIASGLVQSFPDSPGEDDLLKIIKQGLLTGYLAGWRGIGSYLGVTSSPTPEMLRLVTLEAERILGNISPLLDLEKPMIRDRIIQILRGGVLQGTDSGSLAVAVEGGAEFKTWIRLFPREESRDHGMLNGVTIPRDSLFTLPNGVQVFGPRDWKNYPSPEEWINCGHGLVFSRDVTAQNLQRSLTITPRGIPYPQDVVGRRLRQRMRRMRRNT